MDLMTTAEKVLTLQTLCGLELGGGDPKALNCKREKINHILNFGMLNRCSHRKQNALLQRFKKDL